MTSTGKSASIIIIGNEILCGRTADTNSHWIARRLYRMGICVKSIVTIPDVEEEIVRTVQAFAPMHDYVFVAGGIGPTPDDVTRQAIATAFARKLVLHPGAELAIRKRCEGAINEYKLEMARLPEGSQLIPNITLAAPGFRLGNVFVFPGVPQLVREMFEQIVPLLDKCEVYERQIPVELPESEFSHILYSLADRSDVSIGSYPTLHDDGRWTVRIIVSGFDSDAVEEVARQIEAQLGELRRSKHI